MADGPVAVLGATGYTGRLVCDEARALGLPLRLVGRRAEPLAALARAGEETAVADARDPAALRAAFAGASVVASCAGPFLAVGDAPVAAAIGAGAHYLDTTGEQAFVRLVHERHGGAAEGAGLVLLSAFGFDFVPGDLAARFAAEGLEPLDEVAVAYAVSGGGVSRGTRRTVASLAGRGHLAWVDGRLVDSRFGATRRTASFPWGERPVLEWPGAEPLTVPRHTGVRTVRSYVRAPRLAAPLAPLARLAAPGLRALAGLGGEGPPEERRAATRFAVVAEASGPAGGRRVTLAGRDVYRLTALLVARAAEALRAGEARGTGALAPAEAFDARAFARRLVPLLEVVSEERR